MRAWYISTGRRSLFSSPANKSIWHSFDLDFNGYMEEWGIWQCRFKSLFVNYASRGALVVFKMASSLSLTVSYVAMCDFETCLYFGKEAVVFVGIGYWAGICILMGRVLTRNFCWYFHTTSTHVGGLLTPPDIVSAKKIKWPVAGKLLLSIDSF